MHFHLALISLIALVFCVGCAASHVVNPSFRLEPETAEQAMHDMERRPAKLQRPVVVLGGFNDPGIGAGFLELRVRELTGDRRTVGVPMVFCASFDACRDRVIGAVDRAFPSDDPKFTTEVDVIGLSLGGVVARFAAAPSEKDPNARRLKIARLFTISSPHQGAVLAKLPTLDAIQIDLRKESLFLKKLAAREVPGAYEIEPYCRLDDGIVGEQNAAPEGQLPRWVPNQPPQGSHMLCFSDPRILADIARRLRGETPFTSDPRSPLPGRG